MGRPLSPEVIADAREMRARGMSYMDIGDALGLSQNTIWKYARNVSPTTRRRPDEAARGPLPLAAEGPPALPEPAPEAGGPSLPDPVAQSYEPYRVDGPGWYVVIGDIHIPYHDPNTIKAAVREAEQKGAVGVVLNGDVLDCYQLSHHYREPDAPRMKEEIEKGRQLLQWLRSRFPRGRIIFKEGNHDERLRRYLAQKAPELFVLEDVRLSRLLRADEHGVEWVQDKRVIDLGKLPVIHGHEYQGSGGVMPARWLFIRAWSNALCSHFHQPSHFTALTLDRREMGVWSTGCACYLHPAYRPITPWRHGYAMVEVFAGGGFQVVNREVLRDGRVV